MPILDPFGIDTAMTRRLLDEYGLASACSVGLPARADEAGVPVGLAVHLGTYLMNIEGAGFTLPVEQAGHRLGYVHIGESHRGYLGTGTIDFDAFFAALRASGYQGFVTFESFSSAVVHPDRGNLPK